MKKPKKPEEKVIEEIKPKVSFKSSPEVQQDEKQEETTEEQSEMKEFIEVSELVETIEEIEEMPEGVKKTVHKGEIHRIQSKGKIPEKYLKQFPSEDGRYHQQHSHSSNSDQNDEYKDKSL